MTQKSLTANQPRFSIRTYSLGAASVLLAYACLAAGPVNANTITNTMESQNTVQTTPTSAVQQVIGNQSSQTETNNSNTNKQITSNKADSANSLAQTSSPASNQSVPTSSQETTATTRDSQTQTGQVNSDQDQTNTRSTSSSAISQTTSRQTSTSSSQNRITNQARTASIETATTRSSATGSVAKGDDYPYRIGWQVDPWGYYTRQCTSFVAFRLNKVNGFTVAASYGNADQWGYRARQNGYRVDMNPTLGSVAWWNTMHVAWVTAVDGDRVEIEEYNFNYTTNYNRRWIPKNSVSGYIHFKDLAGGTTTSPSNTVSTNQPASNNIPSSGSYTFTGQAAIKAEPKQSSTTLAYYQAGNTVNYDSIVEADGYKWLSYLSFAGNRRYIPIAPVAKPATQQTPATPTSNKLPASGTYTFKSRASIRSQPSLSSAEIAYYNAGSSVNYDKIVTAEGRQWLSYISYSGVRRYIAIP
ncbi:TPA: SH3 domain-containing protein [Streptococcus suis]